MDDADRAQEQIEREEASRFVMAALGYRVVLSPGISGDCEECGEASIRLVDGLCARCRDQLARDMARRQAAKADSHLIGAG